MATLVGIVSVVVNVGVSFMTDGSWKTAGSGLAQFYWNRSQRRRSSPPQVKRNCEKSPGIWKLARTSVPALN